MGGYRIAAKAGIVIWVGGALLAATLAGYASQADRPGWELSIVRAIQGADVPALHAISLAVTQAGYASFAVPMTLLAMIWFVAAGQRRLAVLLAAATCARALSGIIKIATGRERPDASVVDVVRLHTDMSFPSGHVLGTTLLLGTVWYAAFHLIPHRPARLGFQALCVAGMLMMGVSRIELGAHWPTDVLGGYLIGGLILLPLIAIHRHTTRIAAVPALSHVTARAAIARD